MLRKFWTEYYVVFEKLIARKVLSLGYFSDGKGHLSIQDMLA